MSEPQTDLGFTQAKYQRGLVDVGNLTRLKQFHDKIQSGKPIVYGSIGGSITAGASAQKGLAYPPLLANWLDTQTPTKFINAGIGASNSFFGAFRAPKDLLCHMPDLITVEYAVNDVNNPNISIAYEALVRQCLMLPTKPLVIAISTMRRDGSNVQDVHLPIGQHYGLPMLSYRDAIYPEVTAGNLTWEDLSPDEVHPNDAGHTFMFQMLRTYLKETTIASSTENTKKTSDLKNLPWLDPQAKQYTGGQIIDASKMNVQSSHGWTQGPHKDNYTGWQTNTPGAELTLTFTGSVAYLGYKKYAGDFGQIAITLDGQPIGIFDVFFEKPITHEWAGGHTVIEPLAIGLEHKEHKLKIKLLSETHPASHGHEFDLGYLLVS